MAFSRQKQRQPRAQQLLVEGPDDQHVVWHLCEQHGLPEEFDVEVPGEAEDSGGIEALVQELLVGLPVRLKQQNIRTFGIMIDADNKPEGRWQSIRGALPEPMQTVTPRVPVADGWVSEPISFYQTPIRIGIWLMPNDLSRGGMLEDFAVQLIHGDDLLLAKARSVLDEIEMIADVTEQRYSPTHRSKALIHTWLAWQRNPGRPMGTAIKAGYLRHDAAPALAFIAWLRRLFALSPAPEVA
jgi:hypothetical protein